MIWNIYISRLGQFAGWIRLFLIGQTTRFFFTGFISDLIDTATGILQRLSLLPILYLIYNISLIRALAVQKPDSSETEVFGWVDNTAAIAVSQLYADNTAVLQETLTKTDCWTATHISKFVPDKFELIYFTNPRDPDSMQEVSLGQLSLVPVLTPARILTEDDDKFWEISEKPLKNN